MKKNIPNLFPFHWIGKLKFTLLLFLAYNSSFAFTTSCTNCGTSDYFYTVQYDFTSSYRDNNAGCGLTSRLLQAGTNGGSINDCANNVYSGIETNGQGAIVSTTQNVGPSFYKVVYFSANYAWRYVSAGCTCGICVYYSSSECRSYTVTRVLSTASIKAPINISSSIVNASTIPNAQFTKLNWSNNSDIPATDRSFRIYRNGSLIGTVSGSTTTFIDSSLLPTGTYSYSVKNYTSTWGPYESGPLSTSVSITNDLLNATDGTLYSRSRLTWPNIASFATNGVEIRRNGVQIAVANKNATSYNDYDGVPGVHYFYQISPIDANNATPFSFPDSGWSRPNGVIRGNVRSIYNGGVSGVTVTATSFIGGATKTYSSVTDAAGYYELSDIFYDTSSVYTIVPSKNLHRFDPDTLRRTLSQNNNLATNVDFRDTTVFTVSGKVAFASIPTYSAAGCGVNQVDIYKDGVLTGVKTDANGVYNLTIQEEGTYTISPRFKDHTFNVPSRTLFVNDNVFNFDFIDTKFDTLFLSLRGGCKNEIAHHATLDIASTNGCYVYSNYNLSGGVNQQFLVLPAQPYNVHFQQAYSDAVNPDPSILFNDIAVDLTVRDSVTKQTYQTTITNIPADTAVAINGTLIITPARRDTIIDTLTKRVSVQGRADFIHHGTLEVRVLDLDSSGCVTYPLVMKQLDRVRMRVEINEFYNYGGVAIRCPVDSGKLLIYDDVSDLGVQQINFKNGVYLYTANPGLPNIASPYKKVLQFFVNVGNQSANVPLQVLVTGHRPKTQTFVTKTPELPFFVLHDPPGDASYSFQSKDSSYTYTYSNSYKKESQGGVFVDAKIAAGIPIPFTGVTIGAGTHIAAEALPGRDDGTENTIATTFQATRQFSTSASSDFIGEDGDVFVGGSFNMIYALTDVIEFNNCAVNRDTSMAWGANDLATTYIYTAKHIRETLVPQLELVKSLSHGDTIILIQSYIDVWNQVLSKNKRNRDTAAIFKENISFSAGAPYDNTQVSADDSTGYVDYNVFLNVNTLAAAAFGDISGYGVTEFGFKANFRWNTGRTDQTNIVKTKTTGYHLEDVNPGDFYSVDILEDKVYGTPSFKTVAGTSSCPHEFNTQARDLCDISLDNYVVSNVPLNTPATYIAHLTNLSETYESRTYNVQVVPESNLDGAIVYIAGQQINNTPASFTVPTSLPALLSVSRGPLAADYNGLQVRMSSPCDGGQNDVITFDAHFQSSCSPIALYTPSDNWLVNASNNDSLLIIFSGYDASNPKLLNIGLEYRRPGQPTWQLATNPTFSTASLTAPYKNFWFNVANLPDGNYELRAFANCGAVPGGKTYSQVLHGIIDRHTISLFGTPSPSDGILNVSEDISVSFNEPLDCNQQYNAIFSSLKRADNGVAIPHKITCSGQTILIETNPTTLIDSLQNVQLIATIGNVRDLNGNQLPAPITWSFVVNRGQVFWDPSNKNVSVVQGASTTTSATIKNISSSQQDFFLTSLPSWLTVNNIPNLANPTTVPGSNGTFDVNFTISNSLNPGSYDDTVVATVNGINQFLFVHVDVVKNEPNWAVNPALYQYNMSVVTNFSLTDLNAPLSNDTKDKIAVFAGEECRGVANIQYVQSLNRYVAYITAYSNVAVGDTFTFRIWDALPGTEYHAKEKLNFVSDGLIGQPLAPFILHPSGVFQTVYLNSGWNWFSLNVKDAIMTPASILKKIRPANGNVVKTLDKYAQYNDNVPGWQGTLTQFDNSSSYMIKLASADTLRFLGQFVKDTITKSIAQGWNWTGFPRQEIASVNEYLKTFSASTGDIFKSQSQFATFNSGNWNGSLAYLRPGEGYKMRSANATNFVVPPSRSTPNWQLNENDYEYNMTITAVLKFNGAVSNESHYLIGAFSGSTCLGLAQPEFLNASNKYRIFLTVHGNIADNNQPITFKVWDLDNDIEYSPSYTAQNFVTDETVATVENPFELNVLITGINQIYADGYSLAQNVPNPFSENTVIEYSIPTVQKVNISIYDQTGKLVAMPVNETLSKGRHKVNFNIENLPAGVYFYRMTSGEFSKTKKMIIF